MSIFLRWGIPAFVTVVGGTAAAIATSGTGIPADLAARTNIVTTSENAWAQVAFDMRDATVTGTATTQQMVDDVVARVAAVHGVRSVATDVVLAEHVSPFPFVASVQAGVLTLGGGVPDEATRTRLIAEAGQGTADTLRPMSGAPDRTLWAAATNHAIAFAKRLDEGEVALADLTLTVSGRARSAEDYDALVRLAAAPSPEGVELAYHEFAPPLLSPFEWRAEFDGSRLNFSGSAPSDALIAELEALAPADVSVSTSLVLASGAPESFDLTAKSLVENLLRLEHGSADISDGTSTLSGVPADAVTAQAIRVAMTPGGTSVSLGAPLVGDYWFSAERKNGATIVDGFVPDQAMRDRLEAADSVDASGLELGRGAPERFESGVDFVMTALGRMSEGRGSVSGTSITIEGRAATTADFAALETTLDLGAPQGLILASSSIKPPLATPFTFAVEKSADGKYAVTGHVPSEAARKAIVAAVPGAPSDSSVIADGNPVDFQASSVKALDVLALMDSGRLSYDGANWSLTGAVGTAQQAFAAESAFAATGLRAAGWTYKVDLPAATAAEVLPVIDPYTWRARKSPGGPVTFSGFVPTGQLKRYLAGHAGAGVVDGTSLGAGAPDGFIPAAIGGLDALLAMDEGTLSFSAGNWSLIGEVATTDSRHAVEAALVAAADTSAWHVAIQSADAAPVVVPFVWSATKIADGAVTLSGYVPTEEARAALAELAGTGASDKTLVGSGEPPAFADNARKGLTALLALESGEVRYDGSQWSITGQPTTAADVEAAQTALAAAADAKWTTSFAEPTQLEATETAAAEPEAAPAHDPAPTEAATPAAPATADTPATEAETQVAAVDPAVPVVEQASVAPEYVFEATKALGGPVAFAGAVPAEPMRRHLAVITGGEPAESLAIDAGLPGDFIANADAGSRALALLADGQFGLAGDAWVFTGRADTEAVREAALAELAAAPAAAKWKTDVTLLPPLLVCRDEIDTFAARNAILFQSGSAVIAEGSLPAIDELAGYLNDCPGAMVNIEGHTDADGEEDANLALSVSRAEAVVDALILRGIGPERLYAIGYGESLPIASNETRAGKQANRRIAFTLSEE
ncbi:OmpA family protein [Devosia sp. ZB163]|uniref:OmpA family protein n=1 Tax=Devosia sp. ZB163 TaxID=3025938 RepID=UPI002362CDE6|nr:OmpA family protein [Devosia sp. ZB163]MDC9824129.1 OmpA family protein [Devosia sp. ZB163]